jgi:hypothetical protein
LQESIKETKGKKVEFFLEWLWKNYLLKLQLMN